MIKKNQCLMNEEMMRFYTCENQEKKRRSLLPALIEYSFHDIWKWNKKGGEFEGSDVQLQLGENICVHK